MDIIFVVCAASDVIVALKLNYGFDLRLLCKFNTLQKTSVCSMVCLCVKTNVICITNLNIYVIFVTYFLTAPHNTNLETHTKYIITIYYRNFFFSAPYSMIFKIDCLYEFFSSVSSLVFFLLFFFFFGADVMSLYLPLYLELMCVTVVHSRWKWLQANRKRNKRLDNQTKWNWKYY